MLNPNPKLPKSLYIHIPFCSHLCHYCDFTKMLFHEGKASLYVEQLIREIQTKVHHPVETIFIGGGTPTALSVDQLRSLLQILKPLLLPHGEFTIECNVENTNEEKLRLFADYRVNRLSFGVQSFNPDLLQTMNRHHDQAMIFQTLTLAKSLGFHNINVDFIYDLPNQTLKMIEEDLEQFMRLDVDHIATYALTIHPHTVFGIKKIQPVSDEVSRLHYETILKFLRHHGYQRYEVSNFARHGKQSAHNQTYWNNEPYYGCGLGASGFENDRRYINTKNLTRYLQGTWLGEEEILTLENQKTDFFMLKLRMEKGFTTRQYEQAFQETFYPKFQKIMNNLVHLGLIQEKSGQVSLTDEGFLLLDYVVLKLLTDEAS